MTSTTSELKCSTSSSLATAFVYSTLPQTLNSNAPVSWNASILEGGIKFNSDSNGLIVPQDGLYEIEYMATPLSSDSQLTSFQLQQTSNSSASCGPSLSSSSSSSVTIVPGSTVRVGQNGSVPAEVSQSVLVRAKAGDIFQLINEGLQGTVTLPVLTSSNVVPTLGNHVLVSGTNTGSGATTTVISNTPISVSNGSSIYVAVQYNGIGTPVVTSMIDSQGGLFTAIGRFTFTSNPPQEGAEIWYRDNVLAGTNNYVVNATLSYGQGGSNYVNWIMEVNEFQNTNFPSLSASAINNGAASLYPFAAITVSVTRASTVLGSYVMGPAGAGSGTPPPVGFWSGVPGNSVIVDSATRVNPAQGQADIRGVSGATLLSSPNPVSNSLFTLRAQSSLIGQTWAGVAAVIQGKSLPFPDPSTNASLLIKYLGP